VTGRSTDEVSPAEVAMRVIAAAAILVGGLVHLDLYFRYGYRDFPNANLGRSFVANGIASVIVAAALLLRREAIIRLIGIVLAAGTLVAFFMSRHLDKGIFGFTEKGWEPSPQATIAFVAEVVAIVVLAASFVPALRWRQQAVVNVAVAGALALIVVAIGIAAPAVWAHDSTSTASSSDTTYASATTGPPASEAGGTAAPATTGGAAPSGAPAVTIKGFAFNPADVTVKAGDTVTWTNADGTAHTVTASDASFTSDDLDRGATFSHTFATAGSFAYICSIHTGMKGIVTVTG
jgi:plastocyanin